MRGRGGLTSPQIHHHLSLRYFLLLAEYRRGGDSSAGEFQRREKCRKAFIRHYFHYFLRQLLVFFLAATSTEQAISTPGSRSTLRGRGRFCPTSPINYWPLAQSAEHTRHATLCQRLRIPA